jgi:serine/threonine protein phosphatase PrpC
VIFWGRWRVEGVLAVSRAIGDISLKPYVTCDPEIQSKFIAEEDMYMVLASDGLWDVMSNEEVASFVVKYVCCAFLHCLCNSITQRLPTPRFQIYSERFVL